MSTTSHDERADRRESQDELIIAALAAGMTYERAGALGGVSGRTVARRMADPVFARLVADRRGEVVVSMTGELTSMAAEAVDAVRSCLHQEDPRHRLSAAKLVLDLVLKLRDSRDLEIQLMEIRRKLDLEP